jgi:hypothetical protein
MCGVPYLHITTTVLLIEEVEVGTYDMASSSDASPGNLQDMELAGPHLFILIPM